MASKPMPLATLANSASIDRARDGADQAPNERPRQATVLVQRGADVDLVALDRSKPERVTGRPATQRITTYERPFDVAAGAQTFDGTHGLLTRPPAVPPAAPSNSEIMRRLGGERSPGSGTAPTGVVGDATPTQQTAPMALPVQRDVPGLWDGRRDTWR